MPWRKARIMDDKNIMSYERVLPEEFNGTFYFTNPSKDDFIAKWGGKEYLFPAESTVPMVIVAHSPLEIQNIRKKFAKDLAEREFYKSKGYNVLQGQEGKPGNRTMNSIHQAAAYTLSDLTPYIQACLDPMKPAEMRAKTVEKTPIEDLLTKDDEGHLRTEVVDQKTSLRAKALNA